MPLLAQVSSEGQGAESKTTHTLAGVLSRSFAGRDDASEKGYRMVVGLENRQAQEGN